MAKRWKKPLIIVLKVLVSIALLTWVLSKVHWHDFVVSADGKQETAILALEVADPGQFRVVLSNGTAELMSIERLRPVAGSQKPVGDPEAYRRPGIKSTLARLNLWLPALAAICQGLSVVLISYRWWRLLAVQQIHVTLWEAVRLTFLGTFYNQIIPGTAGGDLVKAWYLSKHHRSKTTCLITVLVDRVLGLTGLTLLSAAMLILLAVGHLAGRTRLEHLEELKWAGVLCACILGGLLGGCVLMFSRRLRRWLRLEKIVQRMPMASKLIHANEVLYRYRHHPLSVAWAMWHTFLAQLAFIACISFLGVSLGLRIPWYAYFVYVPLIYIIASLPLVPGGVGLAEGSFVAFFAIWANESEILALALLARLVPVLWALPGVAVAVSGPKVPPAAELEAEMAGAARTG